MGSPKIRSFTAEESLSLVICFVPSLLLLLRIVIGDRYEMVKVNYEYDRDKYCVGGSLIDILKSHKKSRSNCNRTN